MRMSSMCIKEVGGWIYYEVCDKLRKVVINPSYLENSPSFPYSLHSLFYFKVFRHQCFQIGIYFNG